MDLKEKISEVVTQAIADAFMMDAEEVKNNPNRRLREDLGASSMNYFPLISAIEDAFDIEFDFHGFQNEAKTIAEVSTYTEKIIHEQHS